MPGWVGKYRQVFTVVVPEVGWQALHVLLAAYSLLCLPETHLIIVADQSISPAIGLKVLGTRKGWEWKAAPVKNSLSALQSSYHFARKSQATVSPIALDLPGAIILGTREAPRFPYPWATKPKGQGGELHLSQTTPFSLCAGYWHASLVHIHLPFVPEGLWFARGEREIVHSDPTLTEMENTGSGPTSNIGSPGQERSSGA